MNFQRILNIFILTIACMFFAAFFTASIAQEQAHEMMHATHSIDTAQSEASFEIDEVLLGNDKTVVGISSLIEGKLSFDMNDPQAAQVGMIKIDARDFTTDDNRRTGAIQNRILNTKTDGNEFITFEPTSIEGLPENVAVGDSLNLNITGNLMISGTTLESVFAVKLTIASETELQGQASATILHKDFGLSIPKVPLVAKVNEDVLLSFNFVATAVASEAVIDSATVSGLATCPDTIMIENFTFSPAACQVKVGTSITFKNVDSAPHTATSLAGEAASFDTGRLAGGESASIVFDTAASIAYRCDIHTSMVANIEVVN